MREGRGQAFWGCRNRPAENKRPGKTQPKTGKDEVYALRAEAVYGTEG